MTDPTPAATAREAQAIAWAEHSLARNEAVGALFRLLPDSMFPESFDALMERVVTIEVIAAAEAPGRVAALEALAVGWVAYIHGYLNSSGDRYHTATDYTVCRMHPCKQATDTFAAPAPTPSDPVARWTLVPGEDDDCPRCGRAKVRIIQPEYEPGGALCDECGWDSRDTPAPTPSEPVARCGYPGCIRPAAEHRPCPAEMVGGRHFEQLACHPFTPGARDE